MAVEIEKMLVLSTGHVTGGVNVELENESGGKPHWAPEFTREFSWMFHVPPADADHGARMARPMCLNEAFDFARTHGCTWILFDADGPRVEELNWYDW